VFVNPTTSNSAQPISQNNIVAGSDVVFSIEAFGTGIITYQWRKDETPLTNGGNISGVSFLVGIEDISASGIFTIENAQNYEVTISDVSDKTIYKSLINSNKNVLTY